MRKLYIKPLNKKIEIESAIYSLKIENPICFREVTMRLFENIVYSKNDNIANLEKCSLIISNPFQLNVNDSKLLRYLYQKIEKTLLNTMPEEIGILEKQFINMLDNLQYIGFDIDYNTYIDISKLLSSVCLSYSNINDENYIDKLILLISIYKEVYNTEIIISFGLLNMLTQDEKDIIDKKIYELNMTLLDISFTAKNINDSIVVDEDWCVI